MRLGSVHSSTVSGLTRNRHGWVLWTDGARDAAVIRTRAYPASTCACPVVVTLSLLPLIRAASLAVRTGIRVFGRLPGRPKSLLRGL